MSPPIDSKNKAAAPEVVMSVKGKMEAKMDARHCLQQNLGGNLN